MTLIIFLTLAFPSFLLYLRLEFRSPLQHYTGNPASSGYSAGLDDMDIENLPNIDIVDSIDVRQILGLTAEELLGQQQQQQQPGSFGGPM